MMIANSLTFVRLGMFAVFLGVATRFGIASAWPWFAFSWGLDAIDGTIARRFHEESRFGFLLDKIVDRIILAGTGIYLLSSHAASPFILLLFAKDILLLPALLIHWLKSIPVQSTGILGKITTALQGTGLLWFVLHVPYVELIVLPTAIVGAVAAYLYWQQTMADVFKNVALKKQEVV